MAPPGDCKYNVAWELTPDEDIKADFKNLYEQWRPQVIASTTSRGS